MNDREDQNALGLGLVKIDIGLMFVSPHTGTNGRSQTAKRRVLSQKQKHTPKVVYEDRGLTSAKSFNTVEIQV